MIDHHRIINLWEEVFVECMAAIVSTSKTTDFAEIAKRAGKMADAACYEVYIRTRGDTALVVRGLPDHDKAI